MSRSRELVDWLETKKGYPYQWNGKMGRPGYDCSGLVWDGFRQVGIALPHGSANQYRFSRKIPVSKAHEGCLLFKKRSNGTVYHVGVVVIDGVIEAKGTAWGVIKRPYKRTEWQAAGKVDSLFV
ncbi:MAG TPA: NlpC/P60 family protein [Phycisphaerae bacterium]|nr:NlpC/P60 family protein [Phycisphaerae bacterium]